jgi:hypothetical protein
MSYRSYIGRIELSIESADGGVMSATTMVELASITEGHMWLLFAFVVAPVLLVCVTSVILVLSVDPSDRVKAIQALAPVLGLGKPTRGRRHGRGVPQTQSRLPDSSQRQHSRTPARRGTKR